MKFLFWDFKDASDFAGILQSHIEFVICGELHTRSS